MSWLASLWLVGSLLQQTPADAGDLVALRVELRPAQIQVGSDALDATLVCEALQVRLGRVAIDVCIADNARSAWLLVATASGDTTIELSLRDPQGESALSMRLATTRRRPRDLANTIALVTREALLSAVPELARTRAPSEAAQVRLPGPLGVDGSAAGRLAKTPVSGGVQAGATGDLMLPSGDLLAGVTARGTIRRGLLQATLALGAIAAQNIERAANSLVVYRATAALLGGLSLALGPFRAHLGVGPAMRLVTFGAEGPDVSKTHGRYWGLGVVGEGGITAHLQSLTVGAVLSAARYSPHPRFVLNGDRVANSGYAALEAALLLGREF